MCHLNSQDIQGGVHWTTVYIIIPFRFFWSFPSECLTSTSISDCLLGKRVTTFPYWKNSAMNTISSKMLDGGDPCYNLFTHLPPNPQDISSYLRVIWSFLTGSLTGRMWSQNKLRWRNSLTIFTQVHNHWPQERPYCLLAAHYIILTREFSRLRKCHRSRDIS